MKQHEREFFICTIRSGKVFVKDDIVIKAPTNEQHVQSCIVYNKSYEEAFDDEVMTEEEMLLAQQQAAGVPQGPVAEPDIASVLAGLAGGGPVA